MSSFTRSAVLFAAAVAACGLGCTNLLGDVTFNGTGGAGGGGSGGSTSSSSTSTSSSSTSSSSTSSTSSSSSGTGGSGSSSSGTGGGSTCPSAACDPLATCSDTSGHAVCTCPSGYQDVNGDGSKCTDWDECAGQNGGNDCNSAAHPNTTCQNTPGGYTCVCSTGWIGAACDTCVFFVDGGATGAGDGSSWANAFTSVQPALDAADAMVKSSAATCDVWVKAGTYYLFVSSKKNDGVKLRASVGLYGGFAGTETARSAADPTANPTTLSGKKSATSGPSVEHVVEAADVEGAVIDGFTLRDGNADGSGGSPEDSVGGGFLLYAFNDHNASATVSRCEITGNAAGYGAGIGVQWGSPTLTVTGCNVHGNTATTNAGGVLCADKCTVTGTTIQGNTASAGGGLQVSGSSALTIHDDQILGNTASAGDGGGLWLQSAPAGVTLSNLILEDNLSAGNGGGIRNGGTAVVLTNTVVAGNAAVAGAGIYTDAAGGLTCTNCTITGNQGTTGADGIAWANGAPTLNNTIVWGNPSHSSGSNREVSPSTGITTSHCDIGGYTGSDSTTLSTDPIFTSAPRFFDRTTTASGAAGSVVVASATGYAVGDVLEIGGDGTARAVTGINGTTLSFLPALSAPAAAGVEVRDWGSALGTLDLHLATGSPCINAGDAASAPSTDISGQTRVGPPDIGAYEHP